MSVVPQGYRRVGENRIRENVGFGLGEFVVGQVIEHEACSTWSTALDAMDGIHSARARQTVVDMRATLSAFGHRGVPATVELDARACAYLNTGSP